jgi:hypothetical protein
MRDLHYKAEIAGEQSVQRETQFTRGHRQA